jgi:hypothetical protein
VLRHQVSKPLQLMSAIAGGWAASTVNYKDLAVVSDAHRPARLDARERWRTSTSTRP